MQFIPGTALPNIKAILLRNTLPPSKRWAPARSIGAASGPSVLTRSNRNYSRLTLRPKMQLVRAGVRYSLPLAQRDQLQKRPSCAVLLRIRFEHRGFRVSICFPSSHLTERCATNSTSLNGRSAIRHARNARNPLSPRWHRTARFAANRS